MPKPPTSLDAIDALLTMMVMGDAKDITNPKVWIEQSHLGGLPMKGANMRANGEIISALADLPTKGKSKESIKSEMNSIPAQMKADKNIAKKFWAVAYYRYRQQTSQTRVNKSDVAIEIYDLLVAHFPEDVPKGNATKAGQIPKAQTIATEWLGENLS